MHAAFRVIVHEAVRRMPRAPAGPPGYVRHPPRHTLPGGPPIRARLTRPRTTWPRPRHIVIAGLPAAPLPPAPLAARVPPGGGEKRGGV